MLKDKYPQHAAVFGHTEEAARKSIVESRLIEVIETRPDRATLEEILLLVWQDAYFTGAIDSQKTNEIARLLARDRIENERQIVRDGARPFLRMVKPDGGVS